MKLVIVTIILLSIALAGIAIKIWAKKDGKFEGTCAGGNIRMKAEGISCGCGNEGACKNNKQMQDHDHDHDHDHADEELPGIKVSRLKA